MIKNNIFANTNAGYAYYIGTPAAISSSDRNNYFTTGTNLAYWTSNRSNLGALQSANSMDGNSKSVNPGFISNTDLHINNVALNAAAEPLAAVTHDFDGDLRDPLTPDIGADEFVIVANDAGVIAMQPNAICAGVNPISVVVRNFGVDTLTSFKAILSINGVLIDSTTFTGSVPPAGTTLVTVGSYSFQAGLQYDVVVYTRLPNSVADQNNVNDTLTILGKKTGLSGNYTIGQGKNYTSFVSAINDLVINGVCGPVVFVADTGTYVGQLVIPEIGGASATNTITFTSASSDSSNTIISFAASATATNFVIKLDGAKYIIFSKLGVRATGGSFGRVVEFINSANFNRIANCHLSTTSSTSSNFAGIYSSSSKDEFNTIENNLMENGYYGIYWVGPGTAANQLQKGNRFSSNRLTGFYYYGVFASHMDSLSIHGNYLRNHSTSATVYGLYTANCYNELQVTANDIHLNPTGTAYVYYGSSNVGTSAKKGLIANNFFSQYGNGAVYGIYLTSCNFQNIYYNSVRTQSTSSTNYAFYSTGGSEMNVINNAFANMGNGYAYYVATPTAINTSNYNNYYTQGTNLAYWSGIRPTLGALQVFSGKDANSMAIDPFFYSASDLHSLASGMNGAAMPLADVTTDIDGEPRNATTPDIGADEFNPPPFEAQMMDMVAPIGGCGLDTVIVSVRFRNNGSDTIKTSHNMVMSYQIEGNATAVNQNFVGQVIPGDTAIFSFNQKADLSHNLTTDSIFNFTAWLSLAGDPALINDSTSKSVTSGYQPPMPSINDTTIPYGTSVTLSASSPGSVFWWATDTSTVELINAASYTTPVLYDTTTYYVSASNIVGASGVFTVGTGTLTNPNTSYPAPYGNWYYGAKHQFLILASELTALGMSAGNIDALAFNVMTVQGTPLTGFEIKMGHTTQTSLSTSFQSTGVNTVYSSSSYTETAGWNTHTFQTPFAWNGTDNLIVETCFNNTGYTYNAVVYQTSTSFNSSVYYNADASGVCAMTTGTTSMQRPNMQLTANSSAQGCQSARKPVTVNISGIPTIDLYVASIETNTGCSLTTTEDVTIGIANQGIDTVFGGISTAFKVNNGAWITPETVSMNLPPNDTIYYTYTAKANLSAPVSDTYHSITAYVAHALNLYLLNDTLKKDSIESLYTPPAPMTASPVNIPYGAKATLTATANDTIFWLDSLYNTIHKGPTYVTNHLYDTTVFYAEARTSGGSLMVQVGTGTGVNTTTSYPAPYGNFYWGARHQFLIHASELTAMGAGPGTINSLSFNVITAQGTPLTGFEIKMGHSSLNAITSAFVSGLTSVYSVPSYTETAGWNVHSFQTPFLWNGIDNIIVETCFNNSSYVYNAIVQNSTTSFASSVYYNSDQSGVCSMASGTAVSIRPNMRFDMTSSYLGCASAKVPVIVQPGTPPLVDAGVFVMTSPTGSVPSGVQTPVQVQVKNYGLNNLTSATIGWSVNGLVQTPYSLTGVNIANQQLSSVISIGNVTLAGGLYDIKAWTSMPNSVADTVNTNDTIVNKVKSCLNGTYTIGSTTSDFPTIASALSVIDSAGICGHVVFLLDSGVYNTALVLKEVPGMNANNTVTFRSASGDSTHVVIQTNPGTTADNYVVYINGGDYYRIEKMTLKNNSATYGRVVVLSNAANNNRIENCILTAAISTSSSFAGIYVSGNPCEYNTFQNNVINNGYYGIYLMGASTTSLAKGNVVRGNTFNNFYYYGMYLYYQDSLTVEKNKLKVSTASTYPYGMYTYYCQNHLRIVANDIQMVSHLYNAYGMYMSTSSGTATNKGLIANNFVTVDGGTGTNYGIYVSSSDHRNFYYNSVRMASGGTTSYAFYQSGGNSQNVVNNNFTNFAGSYAYYVNSPTAVVTSDHNNYYTTGTNLAYWTSLHTSLASLKLTNNKDANSISVNPVFASSTNLHVNSIDLNGAAVPIAEVTTDIDGDLRHATTPDIGADEFNLSPNDAGIVTINAPVSPVMAGSQNIHVTLRNFGSITLTSAVVNYSINGVSQSPFNWTGSLVPGATADSINVGSYLFTAGGAAIKAWSSLPNGVADGFNYNDTAYKTVIACQGFMKGVYTIGGATANYPDITSAISALSYCGIDSTTIFLINDGSYNEQLVIPAIPGVSSTKTITFRSASNDSTKVVINWNSTVSTANYVVRFNGCSWIRFHQVSINALSTSNGRVVELFDSPSHNTISNCLLSSAGYTTSNASIIYSTTTGNNAPSRNRFENNLMTGGYYSAYIYGLSATPGFGNMFIGNVMKDWYYYGIYGYYQDSLQIHRNSITSSSTTASYLTYLVYCNNGMKATQNKIYMQNASTNYGFYLSACNGAASNRTLIANNFISQTQGTGTAYGFYIAGATTNLDVVYNSVNIASSTAGGAYYQTTSTASNIRLYNNIFARPAGGQTVYISSPGTMAGSDNNNFYSTGGTFAYWGQTASSLSNLQQISYMDSASISVDPMFYSNTDLHVNAAALNAAGRPIANVLVDIDDQNRHATTPDIGADEFTPQQWDAAVVELLQPTTTYAAVGTTLTVEARLRNMGGDTLTSIPVGYVYGNQTPVTATYTGQLLPGASVDYTFVQTFTVVSGTHTLKAYTAHTLDLNNTNDTVWHSFTGMPVYIPAWSDNYDGSQNMWATGGATNIWERGVPAGLTINTAYSAPNVWATRLSMQYPNNADAWLYSPYFNLSATTDATLKFRHWYVTGDANDGCQVQISTNGGQTWANLGYISDPLATNWYTTNISGSHAFSGSSGGWIQSTYLLSAYNNHSTPIQFRFRLFSNTSGTADGWAIDNFELTVPIIASDGGVSSILTPGNTTIVQTAQQVQVQIKNYGSQALTSIPVKYRVNNLPVVSGLWTGNLNPGDSTTYTFATTYNSPSTNYMLTAWTDISGDIYPQNDTTAKSIVAMQAPEDVGVYSIVEPSGHTTVNAQIPTKVMVRNYGTSTVSSMQLELSLNTTVLATENWSGTLAPGDSMQYTFTYRYTSPYGNYQLCAKTILAGDGDPTNDSKCELFLGTGVNDLNGSGLVLMQNRPNPASGKSTVEFSVPRAGNVVFEIHNLLGQPVYREERGVTAGKHQIDLNLESLPAGVYTYGISYEDYRVNKQMVIVK